MTRSVGRPTRRFHGLSVLILALATVGSTVNGDAHAGDTRPFADVPADHPAAAAISYAADKGWFSGYTDGTFRPDILISTDHVAAVTRRAFPTGATRADTASFLVGGAAAVTAWKRSVAPSGLIRGFYIESTPRGHGHQDNTASTLSVLCAAGRLDVVWELWDGISPDDAQTARVEYSTTTGKWVIGGRWIKRGTRLSPPADTLTRFLLAALVNSEPALLTLRTQSRAPGTAVSSTFDTRDGGLVVRTVASLCEKAPATTFDRYRTFADVDRAHPQSWDIRYSAYRGWLSGYTDSVFHPDRTITTSEISRAIRRVLPDRATRADMASFLRGGHD